MITHPFNRTSAASTPRHLRTDAATPAVRQDDDIADDTLFREWRERGVQLAARQLYRRHFDIIYRFFRNKVADPYDVQDLINDTFSRLFRRREQHVEIRSFSQGGHTLRPFLFGIAKNVLCAYIRQRGRLLATADLDDPTLLAESIATILPHSPSSIVFSCQKLYILMHALRTLPLGDQILIEQKYFGDMSERELADLLEIPKTTVPGRDRSACNRLRERVDKMLKAHRIPVDPNLTLEALLAKFRLEMTSAADKPLI